MSGQIGQAPARDDCRFPGKESRGDVHNPRDHACRAVQVAGVSISRARYMYSASTTGMHQSKRAGHHNTPDSEGKYVQRIYQHPEARDWIRNQVFQGCNNGQLRTSSRVFFVVGCWPSFV